MKYTEEEKEVLKTILENKEKILNIDITNEAKRTLKIVIDIIEKQNKEINEKDKLICFNKKYINELEQDLFENASNYVISKEAIREKIKELEESLKEDCIALHEFQRLAKIDVLKELLGE